MTHPKMRTALSAAALAVGLGLAPGAALAQEPATAAEPPAAMTKAPGLPAVTVVAPVTASFRGEVAISGTMVPRDEILVYPQVSGFEITEIAVDIGDSVTKGETLATLSDRTLRAQLAQAEAEYRRAEAGVRQAQSQIDSATASQTQAEAALGRNQSLRDSGSVSQAGLEQAVAAFETARASLASAQDGLAVAQAQVQQAEAQREIAQLNLEYTKVLSPVDGLLSERNGQVGAIAAGSGEPLFRIVRDGLIELEAEVVETELGRVAPGDRVRLSVAGIGEMSGTLRLISPRVDPASRLGTVRIALDPEPRLRSGLFASGAVITEERDALALPTTAILSDATGSHVLVVDEGVVRRQEVIAGLITDDLREVVTGLEGSETVIANAGAFFRDGDKVRPVTADAE